MSETKEGQHWVYKGEGDSKLMERFVGPAFVQWTNNAEKDRRRKESKKRKTEELNQELLEEVRAVSEGKSLEEFRKEKE